MTNSTPIDVAREATGTDPRLEIIADVLRGLIPGAVPANLTVHIEEQLLAGQNSWHGSVEAVAAKIHTALYSRPSEKTVPVAEESTPAERLRHLRATCEALRHTADQFAQDVADAKQAVEDLALDGAEFVAAPQTDGEHRRTTADMTPAQWAAYDYLAARQAQQYGDAR